MPSVTTVSATFTRGTFGTFTVTPLIVVIGIHFVARTEAERAARWIFATASGLYAASALAILLLAQLMLGTVSYLGKFTASLSLPPVALVGLTTLHLVTGALMLAASVVLSLRAYRLSARPKSAAGRAVLSEQYSV